MVTYHVSIPHKSSDDAQNESLMEQCRTYCLTYGLLPTGNVAKDANAFLDAAGPKQLTVSLVDILNDQELIPEPSQAHPLLGQPAPAFELSNHLGNVRRSQDWIPGQPTILVFYYGYVCSHCVAQLFGIGRDLHYFHELGADVVALSPDTPEHTAKKYREYGRFHFPVLADIDNKVARLYGACVPAENGIGMSQDHATFIIDSHGIVVWAYRGPQPFLDNKSLLLALAQAQGIAPRKAPARSASHSESNSKSSLTH